MSPPLERESTAGLDPADERSGTGSIDKEATTPLVPARDPVASPAAGQEVPATADDPSALTATAPVAPAAGTNAEENVGKEEEQSTATTTTS